MFIHWSQMQSFFAFVILFLAAGSNAKPCGRRPLSSTSSMPAVAAMSTSTPLAAASSIPSTTQDSPVPANDTSASGGGLDNLGSGTSASADGFCNVVFNTNVGNSPGWPSTVWSSMTSNGVSGFIAFSLAPLTVTPVYTTSPLPDAMQAAQIPVCMDPSKVNDAKTALTGSSPPPYMELFNEPDYSYHGFTPLTSPEDAGVAVQPLMSLDTTTKMVSPAPAITSGDWLSRFKAACNGCMDKIDIVAAHIYSKDPTGALYQITTLHNAWPDKRLWLTELAPASDAAQGCTLDEQGMIGWMNTVIPQIKALGYVDKIFWNHGESVCLFPFPPPFCWHQKCRGR